MIRRAILSLFRQRSRDVASPSAVRADLSPAIIAMIDTAHIMVRPADENGPRILVQMENRAGWMFTDEKAAGVLQGIFPELATNTSHLSQALQRLRARVRARLQGLDAADPEKPKPWATRY